MSSSMDAAARAEGQGAGASECVLFQTCVVGADFGQTGDEAIGLGLQLVARRAVQRLHMVHVLAVDPDAPDEELEIEPDARFVRDLAEDLAGYVERLARERGLPDVRARVQVEVRKGLIAEQLVDAVRAHQADLLIVGSHGRRGLVRWVAGSVAQDVARCADCSVWVARTE